MDKTLGQIAFEAPPKRFCEWEDISPEYQKEWEHVAKAVAAAVKEEDAQLLEAIADDKGAFRLAAAKIRASIKEVKW